MEKAPLIVFLHIPKTAGLTMRDSILARQYGAGKKFSTTFTCVPRVDASRSVGVFADEFGATGLFAGMRRPDDIWYPESLQAAAARFSQLPDESRARVRLFYGSHIEFGVHAYLSQLVAYFTFLREPVERVLSHYYFARERRRVPENMSLSEHIAAYVEANLQTRLLAGQHDRNGVESPDEMLARAKRNLRACAVVGLTERFDETVLLLKKAFGWRMPLYERQNVSKQRLPRQAIPADVLRQIEADNRLDMALYAYAQELFEAQVSRYGPALARDLSTFRALNFLWQRGQAGRESLRESIPMLGKRIIDPGYWALARWGGLRRVLPSRLVPRVVASVENNRIYFDLKMGERVVGYYDPKQHTWEIQRPFHLLVDERTLPSAARKAAT